MPPLIHKLGKQRISRVGRSVIIPVFGSTPNVITIISGLSPVVRKKRKKKEVSG